MPPSDRPQIAKSLFTRPGLLGAVVDNGLLASIAARYGVDFLLALSAAESRQQGVSTLAAYLPFGLPNAQTEDLLRRSLLPRSGSLPVFAGAFAYDDQPLEQRFERWRDWGVAGVINYPTVSLLEGSLRAMFEACGHTLDDERDLLARAHHAGLAAVGFTLATPHAVAALLQAPLDGLILSLGVTRDVTDQVEHRDRLQQAVHTLGIALSLVRAERPGLPCFLFGGPIATADDLAEVCRHYHLAGFVGGSVFSSWPIEAGVGAALTRFRSVLATLPSRDPQLGGLVGQSRVMRDLFRLLERAARVDLTVMILGESGVGKELIATQLHRQSPRQHGPLVTLNCGAIPEALLESELFGHERGAFTGADHRRAGKFELANGGTLFLDEIGDLSPRGQVALLRALQQREVVRVGGDQPVAVNCRVVCATNRPLEQDVRRGVFREDLFYRLNALTLRVPSLRDRTDDLPLLIAPMLASLSVQLGRRILGVTPVFLQKLERHAWRGNVRELEHVLSQTAFNEEGEWLEGRGFQPEPVVTDSVPLPRTSVVEGTPAERLQQAERALAEARGNKSRAAAALGVTRKTLYAWLTLPQES